MYVDVEALKINWINFALQVNAKKKNLKKYRTLKNALCSIYMYKYSVPLHSNLDFPLLIVTSTWDTRK